MRLPPDQKRVLTALVLTGPIQGPSPNIVTRRLLDAGFALYKPSRNRLVITKSGRAALAADAEVSRKYWAERQRKHRGKAKA